MMILAIHGEQDQPRLFIFVFVSCPNLLAWYFSFQLCFRHDVPRAPMLSMGNQGCSKLCTSQTSDTRRSHHK